MPLSPQSLFHTFRICTLSCRLLLLLMPFTDYLLTRCTHKSMSRLLCIFTLVHIDGLPLVVSRSLDLVSSTVVCSLIPFRCLCRTMYKVLESFVIYIGNE